MFLIIIININIINRTEMAEARSKNTQELLNIERSLISNLFFFKSNFTYFLIKIRLKLRKIFQESERVHENDRKFDY